MNKKNSIIKDFFSENLQLVAVFIIPLLIGLFKPNYLKITNLNNVLDLSSILIISAVGFSLILELGSIDLSIEANMALAGVVMATALEHNPNLGFMAILIAMVTSAVIGFINGIICTKIRIPSFIATLGMSYIASGMTTVIAKGRYINFEDILIRKLAIGRIGGIGGVIPNSLVIAIFIIIIFGIICEKGKLGRHIIAIGGDESIAKDLGINVDKVKIISFSIAGATFGLAGALLSLKLGAGDSFSAVGYTFETISACVIGGIAISGGIGRVHKAVLGGIIITLIRVGMVFFVVPSTIQAGLLGIVIILTVASTLDRSKLGNIR